jgi:hypothetical protein
MAQFVWSRSSQLGPYTQNSVSSLLLAPAYLLFCFGTQLNTHLSLYMLVNVGERPCA